MKLGLVIASHGRADILQRVVDNLFSQSRIPDDIVISVVDPEDVSEVCRRAAGVRSIFGDAGLTRQRNRGMLPLLETADVIMFLDDDFIVGNDYFLNVEKIFAQDGTIIGVNGEVVADGANSPGFTVDEGLRLAEQYGRQTTAPYMRDIEGTYGCNMAFRAASIGSQRFDERLPLYGWQEDLDFCGGLRGRGRDRPGRISSGEFISEQSAVRVARFASVIRRSSIQPISCAKAICRLRTRPGWRRRTYLPISSRAFAQKAISTAAAG